MTKPMLFLAGMTALFLAACSSEGRYPVSGDECGPTDPVKEMSVPDCPTL
ncbi:MAG: hypothetical protein JXR14_01400 [Paracoccaceae bacterium]